jgi:hypothetical protein
MGKKAKKSKRNETPVVMSQEHKTPARPGIWLEGVAVKALLWCLFAVFVVIYISPSLEDYDLWFHLRYGEHHVKNATLYIDHTIYSWTPTLQDWKYVTWIGSSALYLIYNVFSMPGLSVLQWLILAGLAALYVFYLRSRGRTPGTWEIAALTAVFMAVKPSATLIKPELFTVLLFGGAVFLYFRGREGDERLFYGLPALMLIWVNTHGGYIIGLFFLTLCTICEVLNTLFIKQHGLSKKGLTALIVAVALSYVAVSVNPYGPAYLIETIGYLTSSEYMAGARNLMAYARPWKYLFPKMFKFSIVASVWLCLSMMALFIWASWRSLRQRRFDTAAVVVTTVFFIMGMTVARSSFFFPIFWLFAITAMLGNDGSISKRQQGHKASLAALGTSLALMVLCIYASFAFIPLRTWIGEGPERDRKSVV